MCDTWNVVVGLHLKLFFVDDSRQRDETGLNLLSLECAAQNQLYKSRVTLVINKIMFPTNPN